MDRGDERFDHIAELLLADGAEPGKMFGSRALTFEGKAFACLKRGMFAGKLGAGSDDWPRLARTALDVARGQHG